MSSIKIQAINLVDEKITVLFNNYWVQEDVNTLSKLLLNTVSNITIKETIIGADRENIRFHWLDSEFILNFECYSQSCWLELQNSQSTSNIHNFFNLLTVSNTCHA